MIKLVMCAPAAGHFARALPLGGRTQHAVPGLGRFPTLDSPQDRFERRGGPWRGDATGQHSRSWCCCELGSWCERVLMIVLGWKVRLVQYLGGRLRAGMAPVLEPAILETRGMVNFQPAFPA
jgi:hypothetical protein